MNSADADAVAGQQSKIEAGDCSQYGSDFDEDAMGGNMGTCGKLKNQSESIGRLCDSVIRACGSL